MKKAMVRNMWTVLRPNITKNTFERANEQPWAYGLKQGTHRLRQSWVDKRFENLDEGGFPKPLTEDAKLPEHQVDASYSIDAGSQNELTTWQLMVQTGEMTEEALRECSLMPFMEYEVSGTLDFEGLEEAKELLASPKKRRIEAGVDPMLSRQGLLPEERRKTKQRRIQNMDEKNSSVKESVKQMRLMADEGYNTRQIGMKLIVPQMGKKVSGKRRRLTPKQKANQKLRSAVVKRKAAAKAKAEAKAKAKAKAKASPENSGELHDEPENSGELHDEPENSAELDDEQAWKDLMGPLITPPEPPPSQFNFGAKTAPPYHRGVKVQCT